MKTTVVKTAEMTKAKPKGHFITFEGGEGVGKTTLIDLLYDTLQSEGRAVIKTRAPGGTVLGHQIRDLLLHQEEHRPTKKAELLLFLADRAQHVEEVILPALQQGDIVLCDRFNDSTLAYQGAARSFDLEMVRHLCSFATSHLLPDLTFFLDLDPQIGLQRTGRGAHSDPDRLEKENLEFHTKVRQAFLSFSKEEPSRFHVIDASHSSDVVFNSAIQAIRTVLCLS